MEKPIAIVIAAFDRPASLQRLLGSLVAARYPVGLRIPLVISLDKSDTNDVLRLAEEFVWPHGEKRIIAHPDHLGLREHILRCGDLSEEFGAVLVLEDDITVSPAFYDYLVQAQDFYAADERIGGVSLYSYSINPFFIYEGCALPFSPLDDGRDNYFVKYAASWGQCWTWKQWKGFRHWLAGQPADALQQTPFIPAAVRAWSDHSWKKWFIKYLVVSGKYFVFPRTSLSLNWMDKGMHAPHQTRRYQVPLYVGEARDWNFSPLDDSKNIYDAHFELESGCLLASKPELKGYEFEMDLAAMKRPEEISSPYVITSREGRGEIFKSYGASMTPLCLNIIFDVSGDALKLVKKEDVIFHPTGKKIPELPESEHILFPFGKFKDLKKRPASFFRNLKKKLGMR